MRGSKQLMLWNIALTLITSELRALKLLKSKYEATASSRSAQLGIETGIRDSASLVLSAEEQKFA